MNGVVKLTYSENGNLYASNEAHSSNQNEVFIKLINFHKEVKGIKSLFRQVFSLEFRLGEPTGRHMFIHTGIQNFGRKTLIHHIWCQVSL